MKTEQEIVLQKKMIIIFSLIILAIIMGALNIEKSKLRLAKLEEIETKEEIELEETIKVYSIYTANEEFVNKIVSGENISGELEVEGVIDSGELPIEKNENISTEVQAEAKEDISEEIKKETKINESAETSKEVTKENKQNNLSEQENEEKVDEKVEEKKDAKSSTTVTSRGSYIRDKSTPPTEYEKIIKVKATAYCLCKKCCGKSPENPYYGYTASGLRIVPGTGMKVIAVDPSVVALGTNVYVEGLNGAGNYGYAVAADTGSAIKNNKIDLYMDTHQQALSWGVKNVNLYILSK